MLRGLSPGELQSLLLSVGTHRGRRRLSPPEVARYFQRALDAGESLASCASAVGFRGPTMVSRFTRLLALGQEIEHLIDWGQGGASISFSAASELGRLGRDELGASAAAILAHQMKKEEAKQLVQLRLRSGRPLSECVDSVLKMRPQVTRLNVYVGTVADEQVARKLEGMDQSARDQLLRDILASSMPALGQASAKLGASRFTVVGGEQLAAYLRREGEKLEVAVNQELHRRTV